MSEKSVEPEYEFEVLLHGNQKEKKLKEGKIVDSVGVPPILPCLVVRCV